MNARSSSWSGSGQGDAHSEALARFRADVASLEAIAAEAGIELPYSPGFIVRQEWRGHVVDLATGAIVLGGANERHVGPVGGCR